MKLSRSKEEKGEKGLNTAVIGIGSNIEARKNIRKMLDILEKETEVIAVSDLIQTKPIGIEDQPEYTNGAMKIRTTLTCKELIRLLKRTEDMLGRDRRGPKYGPRTMDLDIVVWNGEIVDRDYYTRDFLKNSVDQVREQ